MAKTATERKQEERKRNKMTEEDRLSRLLSRRLSIDLFHNDDAKLKRSMQRAGIEEEQDLISRLIHAADRMTEKQLAEHIRLS
ncbi:hypothetical protein [Pseudomonas viciae]|uniref:hypothetical protein n=1 Tax=Pseudomonas viciae TaxID=2505979 RepID=UPI0022344272|nr:hypothetical protein [Pseudomonas viciae]UZE84664.1 hypothetical protein LOY66_18930 [Pseudomonas viciae]